MQRNSSEEKNPNRFDALDNEIVIHMMNFLTINETVALSLVNRSMHAAVVYKYTSNEIFDVTDESKASYPQQIFQYPQSLCVIELGRYFYPKEHPLKLVDELTTRKSKRDGYGANPLITLCERGYWDVVTEPQEPTTWPWAINFKMLTLLFSIGYDVNYKDAYGMTGLDRLLQKNYPGGDDFLMVNYYLAQPNLSPASINFALATALNNIRISIGKSADTYNITDILETKKVNLNIPLKDGSGMTLLHHVAKRGNYVKDRSFNQNTIELFKRYEAKLDFTVKDNEGKRPEDHTEKHHFKAYLICHRYLQELASESKETKQDTSHDADAISALLDKIKSTTSRKKVNFEELEKAHPPLLESKRITGFYQDFKERKLIKKTGKYEDVQSAILKELKKYRERWFKSEDRCALINQLIDRIQKLNSNSLHEMRDLISKARLDAVVNDNQANIHVCFFKRNTFTGGRFNATLSRIYSDLCRLINNNRDIVIRYKGGQRWF